MNEVVFCPACGAPLDAPREGQAIVCDACGNVIQPEWVADQIGEPEVIDADALPVESFTLGESGEQTFSDAQVFTPITNDTYTTVPPVAKKTNWGLIIGIIVAALLLLCVCLPGAFLLLFNGVFTGF